jgi:hypothetical protein
MMGLGVEVEIGVSGLAVHFCVPESHQVSCKCLGDDGTWRLDRDVCVCVCVWACGTLCAP